jgi:hypothetical protein
MSALSLTDAQVRSILAVWGVSASPVAILAVRDADGDGNEFGVYDDKFYVVTPAKIEAFAGNTDPSSYVQGRAQMETGQVVWYRAGIHKISLPPGNPRRYPAFRQIRSAWFNRKGEGREFDNIAANLHRGGLSGGTSSLACQTVPAERWETMRASVYSALGVSIDGVRHSPAGTGPEFPYLILSRSDVAAALEKGAATPKAEAEPPAKLTWQYLFEGKPLSGVKMVAGTGFAPTRLTMGRFTGSSAPALLEFEWAPDGPDADTSPDLLFVRRGKTHAIEVLDASEAQTLGKITDMAKAAGLAFTVNAEGRTVTISRVAQENEA